MTNEPGRSASDSAERVLLRDPDGAAYAVPLAVLEAHRLTPAQRAELDAQLQDIAGYRAETAPPPDAALYALTPEELTPYRLSDAERDAREARGAAHDRDVQGYVYTWSQVTNTPGTYVLGKPPPPSSSSQPPVLVWSQVKNTPS